MGLPAPTGSLSPRGAAGPGIEGLTARRSFGVPPETFVEGIEGAVDRYVAMTRATQQLVILTSS